MMKLVSLKKILHLITKPCQHCQKEKHNYFYSTCKTNYWMIKLSFVIFSKDDLSIFVFMFACVTPFQTDWRENFVLVKN